MLAEEINKKLHEQYTSLASLKETSYNEFINNCYLLLGQLSKKLKSVQSIGVVSFVLSLVSGGAWLISLMSDYNNVPSFNGAGYIVVGTKVYTDPSSFVVFTQLTHTLGNIALSLLIIGVSLYLLAPLFQGIFAAMNTKFIQKYNDIKKNRAEYDKNVENNLKNIYINDFVQNSGLFTENEISEFSQDLLELSKENKAYTDGPKSKLLALFQNKDPRVEVYKMGVAKEKKQFKDFLLSADFNELKLSESDFQKAYDFNEYYQAKPEDVLKGLEYNVENKNLKVAFDITKKSLKLKDNIDRELSAIEKMKNDYYGKEGIGVLGDKVKVRV